MALKQHPCVFNQCAPPKCQQLRPMIFWVHQEYQKNLQTIDASSYFFRNIVRQRDSAEKISWNSLINEFYCGDVVSPIINYLIHQQWLGVHFAFFKSEGGIYNYIYIQFHKLPLGMVHGIGFTVPHECYVQCLIRSITAPLKPALLNRTSVPCAAKKNQEISVFPG